MTALRVLGFLSTCALASACGDAEPEQTLPEGPLDHLSANRVIFETGGSSSPGAPDASPGPEAGSGSSHLPAAGSGGTSQPPAAGSGGPEVDAGSAQEDAGTQPELQTTPELLHALQKSCQTVGGSYRDEQCQCPDGKVFGTWPSAACRPTEPGTSSCNSKGYVSTFMSGGASALRRCLAGSVLHVARSSLMIGNTFPDDMAEPLAKWLDANIPTGALRPKLASDADTPQSVRVEFTYPDPLELPMRSDGLPYPMPGAAPLTVNILRYVYVSTVEEIALVLGAAPPSAAPDRSGAPALLSQLLAASDHTPFAPASQYDELSILDGCELACEISAENQLSFAGQSYAVRRTRRYHAGSVFDERLELTSPDRTQLFGLIAYDLAGQPNYLATFEYPSAAFAPLARMYDRALRPTGEQQFDVLAAASVEQTARALAGLKAFGADEVAVVVCESDFGGALEPALAERMLRGPHAGDVGADGASFFGWRRAKANDAAAYLDGVISARYALPLGSEHFQVHSRESAHLALGIEGKDSAWPGLRMIPMSERTCILEPTVLREIAQGPDAARIRVLSLSAELPLGFASCAEHMPKGADEHFLWVAAAGNAGREFADLMSAQGCPQSLAQRANIIVVDGVDKGLYWDLADRGPRYSDIAASCVSEDGACNGTSAAAPRVAHAAARIVQAQGDQLSNQMVRAAILLSAELMDPPLPNRSGGVLNTTKALELAQALVAAGLGRSTQLTEADARPLLTAAYGATLAEPKLQRLADNGFFKE